MMNVSKRNLIPTALLALLVGAMPALAGPDVYGLGTGRDGPGAANPVNRYARVTTTVSSGSTSILIAGAVGWSIAPGDLVMVIQMSGISPEPASGHGDTIDIRNDPVGRWELGRVASATATSVTLTEPLLNTYAAPGSQVVRVPEFTTVNINSGVNPTPWNGSTGGVLAFLATGTVTNNNTITGLTRGFRSAPTVRDTVANRTGCDELDEPVPAGGRKGEGIALSRYSLTVGGYGRVTNGGGGGNCYRAGGGGGGNGGAGGNGGNSDIADGNRPVGGQGGAALLYSALDRLVPGGGGGAGHAPNGTDPSGGIGGSIIFFRAAALAGNGNIVSDGTNAPAVFSQDSGGGGGAGGTIHIRLAGNASCNALQANGGNGASTNASNVGPGGGGAGGRILFQACGVVTCAPTDADVQGGAAGIQQNPNAPGGSNYGAQPGAPGIIVQPPGCYSPLPVPVVVTPAHNSSTNDATPTYTGTLATPFPVGTEVILYVDGVEVARVTPNATGNWSFTPTVPLAQGVHNVYAVAVNSGLGQQSARSDTNTFTVDLTPPPAPVVQTPANGSVTSDNTPTYGGTAEPGSTVTVIVDGVVVGTTVATGGNWSFTPIVPLADGPHMVSATATDAAGNTSANSNTNTFNVDTIPPAAPVVVAPANGAVTSDNTPTYSGTAEPGVTVTVIVDGVSVGTTTATGAGTWSLTPAAPLADGPHSVKATALDVAGNTSADSNTNTFIVDTVAPTAPVVTTPANGSVTNDSTPTYSGTAEPGSTVTVIVDGVSVGTTVATAGGSWSFTPTAPLPDGSHTVRATATDAAGNTSANSNTNTFTVDTTPPPAPVVLSPSNGAVTSDNTPAYSGTAQPGSTVTVIVDGVSVGTTTATGAGTWSFTPTAPLPDGQHTVSATASDTAGNTSPSSNTNTFTVDTTAPAAPVVVAPANGAVTNDNTPTYSGTAEPGSTVTVIVDGVSVGTTTATGAG
ncbi:MAG TPA: Ig-like domain-containing protein, partial [Myxococcaceae bacterium]